MELNRNQYFFMGVLLLLLGMQLRMVSSFVLSEEATQFLAARAGQTAQEGQTMVLAIQGTGARKVIQPPDWLGWCLISIGAVLVLHSLAMPKPSG